MGIKTMQTNVEARCPAKTIWLATSGMTAPQVGFKYVSSDMAAYGNQWALIF